METLEILWPKNGAIVQITSDEPQHVEFFDPRSGCERPILGIPCVVEQGCLRKKGLLSLNFLFGTEILTKNSEGVTVKHHFNGEEAALKELQHCTLKYHWGRNANGHLWRFFSVEKGLHTFS